MLWRELLSIGQAIVSIGTAVSRAASEWNGENPPHTGEGKKMRAHFCIKGSFVFGRP